MTRLRHRRAFSLLEVMVALALLVVSLSILLETMSSAAIATREAEHIVTATQLAQEKLTEVQIYIEKEGITEREVRESGDFDDLGDEQLDLEFGEALQEYYYEWTVAQIDLGLAGDIATMAEDLSGTGLLPESDEEGGGLQDNAPDLGSLGISNDMISEMLGRYIREVRVRVWWGEDAEEAEERGDEVIVTMHVTDPAGGFVNITGEEAQ